MNKKIEEVFKYDKEKALSVITMMSKGGFPISDISHSQKFLYRIYLNMLDLQRNPAKFDSVLNEFEQLKEAMNQKSQKQTKRLQPSLTSADQKILNEHVEIINQITLSSRRIFTRYNGEYGVLVCNLENSIDQTLGKVQKQIQQFAKKQKRSLWAKNLKELIEPTKPTKPPFYSLWKRLQHKNNNAQER